MMQSFPKFMRSEVGPRGQDSPFPPFKIEHRYKGVYERAGFEVNLNKKAAADAEAAQSTSRDKSSIVSPRDNKSIRSLPRRAPPQHHQAHGVPQPSASAISTPDLSKTSHPYGKKSTSISSPDIMEDSSKSQPYRPQRKAPTHDRFSSKSTSSSADGVPRRINPYDGMPHSATSAEFKTPTETYDRVYSTDAPTAYGQNTNVNPFAPSKTNQYSSNNIASSSSNNPYPPSSSNPYESAGNTNAYAPSSTNPYAASSNANVYAPSGNTVQTAPSTSIPSVPSSNTPYAPSSNTSPSDSTNSYRSIPDSRSASERVDSQITSPSSYEGYSKRQYLRSQNQPQTQGLSQNHAQSQNHYQPHIQGQNDIQQSQTQNPYADSTHSESQSRIPQTHTARSNSSSGIHNHAHSASQSSQSYSHERQGSIVNQMYAAKSGETPPSNFHSNNAYQNPNIYPYQEQDALYEEEQPADEFDFSPQVSHPKNFKNLSLNLNDNIDYESDQTSPRYEQYDSQRYESANHTKETSVDKTTSDRLSTELEGLKKDVHHIKQDSMSSSKWAPSVSSVPVITNSGPFPNPVEHNQAPAAITPSFPNSSLTTDYQQFLTSNPKPARHSQISMVSSIISKDSIYDDEDSEVEKELERQLQTLKLNGAVSIESPVKSNEVVPVSPEKSKEVVPVPTFSIPMITVSEDEPEAVFQSAESEDVPYENPYTGSTELPPTTDLAETEDLQSAAPKVVSQAMPYPVPSIITTEPEDDNVIQFDSPKYSSPQKEAKPGIAYPVNDPFIDMDSEDETDQGDNVQEPSEVGTYFQATESPASRVPAKNVSFNDNIINQTPRAVNFSDESSPDSLQSPYQASEEEFVRPLSPKNHAVEKELDDMNFKIGQPSSSISVEGSPILPLRRHPNTSQFVPQYREEPALDQSRSEVPSLKSFSAERNLESSDFSDSLLPAAEARYNEQTQPEIVSEESNAHKIHSPGEGPCRSCLKEVLPNSKGGEKAIFSKTGELSGQWHRSCFSCYYDGCNVHFNKHVQCYAYGDLPYCNHHYHELNNTLCELCSIGIEGECIENELNQKWHLHCLKCFKCHNPIKDDYYLFNGLIVCEADALAIMDGRKTLNGKAGQDKIEKRRTRLMFVD